MTIRRNPRPVRVLAAAADAALLPACPGPTLGSSPAVGGECTAMKGRPGGAVAGNTGLSDAQIRTVRAATTGAATANGKWSYSGAFWGAEDNRSKGWGEYLWPIALAPFRK